MTGGQGINLTSADTVIFVDSDFTLKMTYKLQPEHTGLVKPGTVDSQIVQFVLFTYIQTRNYGINNMNLEHITE